MTKNLPRIISELVSIDWIGHLFENFTLDHINTPEFKLHQTEYYHASKFQQYDLKSYTAKDISIALSKYFKSFCITIHTEASFIFDRIEEFCANKSFTQKESFKIKGKREKTYCYLEEEYLSNVRITKFSDNLSRIIIWYETIEKTPKKNIEFELSISGELKISQTKNTPKFYDYSECSKEELEFLSQWKNVELSKKLHPIQTKMESWIENLYECWVGDSKQQIKSIYLSEKQKTELEKFMNETNSSLINIMGKFKMFRDYDAILCEIKNIKQIKHR